jgi:hypothetical protein
MPYSPPRAASEVVRQAQGALSLLKAGTYLNAPRVHIELLAENDFIKPHVPARAFAAADKYAVADLDDFLGRLFERAHPVRKAKATLARIESHHLQSKLVINLLGPRMFIQQLGNECLLFCMRRDDTDARGRFVVQQIDHPVDNTLGFHRIYVALIDKAIMIDRIKFDDVIDRNATYFRPRTH